ncbi:MAG: glycosyltransferase [Candidatus Nomurabacteria bacterium]|jgi:dolichol-phosphate mannosyltransferase|nr:glycosyltransferase [Candidatus Nomurabacteria bacterium]
MKIALVIPTYNESENIALLLKKLAAATAKIQSADFKFYFVDDNSPDQTAAEIRRCAKLHPNLKIKIIKRPRKRGLGSTYCDAFSQILRGKAKFDYVGQMDADLSHNPEYLTKFVKAANCGKQLILATRYRNGGKVYRWKVPRRLLSRLGNNFIRRLLGKSISDYTGGFNFFKADLLKEILPNLNSTGYEIQVELKALAKQFCRPNQIAEIPIVFQPRHSGSSKMPGGAIWRNLQTTLRLWRKSLTLRCVLLGILPAALFWAAVGAAMIHIGSSYWREIYLYNGDSLTPAMIAKKLLNGGESLKNFVSGTQLWFFPEGLIALGTFWLSSVLNLPVQWALIFNSIVNLLLLYWLIRASVRSFSSYKSSGKFGAGLAIGGLVGLMLLETKSSSVSASIVTPFLFNGNYYGAILVGLAGVLISVNILRGWPTDRRRRRFAKLIGLTLLIAIAHLSNPMLLLFFTAPFGLILVILLLQKRIRIELAWWLLGALIIATLLGQIVYKLLSHHLLGGVTSRISIGNNALADWQSSIVGSAFSSVQGGIELILLIVLLFASVLFALVVADKRQNRPENLVVLFSGLAPFILLAELALLGSSTPRYLLPVAIFPLVNLAIFLSRYRRRILAVGASVSLVLLLIYSSTRLSNLKRLDVIYPTDSVACQIDLLNQNHITAFAASDYISHALDFYGSNPNVKSLMVTADRANGQILAWPWQDFADNYSRDFHYIFTTAFVAPRDSIYYPVNEQTTPDVLSGQFAQNEFGRPDRIYHCGSEPVYYYAAPRFLPQPAQNLYRQYIDSRR